jgi:hypothetical protein
LVVNFGKKALVFFRVGAGSMSKVFNRNVDFGMEAAEKVCSNISNTWKDSWF